MIYHDFCGEQVSSIGMGCMRLPVLGGDENNIDVDQVNQMVDYALDHGVNYFDTAYGYHGGTSERVIGQTLRQYPRDSYFIATKWPGYSNHNFGKVGEIFEEQLKKTGMDFFDFYLIHNVTESNIDNYLNDEKYHTISYLVDQQKAGRIHHLGFSCHGEFDVFKRYMDAYADYMEFCQIQLNYQDWNFQHAYLKVNWLNAHQVPIIVMEPLRGGNLIEFSDDEAAKLEPFRPGISAVEWGYRYAQSMPGVALTLSGMSNISQCVENVSIFETEAPLSDEERQALYDIAAMRLACNMVGCTACRYCTSFCPNELDIPYLIAIYNEDISKTQVHWMRDMKLAALPDDKKPNACIACGACAEVCPQHIGIPEVLEKLAVAAGLE